MKRLTKNNGYNRTEYIFLDRFDGNRRIYEKSGRFFVEARGKVFDVTDKDYCFLREKSTR